MPPPLFAGMVVLTVSVLASPPPAAQTVYADSLGYDAEDATAALQAAFDSGARRVVVRDVGSPWVVSETLYPRSNQEVVFEPGVLILAKEGAFKGLNDELFRMVQLEDVTFSGYGATFRMRRDDYASEPGQGDGPNSRGYLKSEWRHGIALYDCHDVTIEGLHVEGTGGDGIGFMISFYPTSQGGTRYPSSTDVVVRDVVLSENYRLGMAITAVDGLLVENAVFKDSDGTFPKGGVDFEPDWDVSTNVVFRNAVFYNSTSYGLDFYLFRHRSIDDFDVRLEHVHSAAVPGVGNGRQARGFSLRQIYDAPANGGVGSPGGSIVFEDCSVHSPGYNGLFFQNKSALRASVTFRDCLVEGPTTETPSNSSDPPRVPIYMATAEDTQPDSQTGPRPITFGGIALEDVTVNDDRDRPFLQFEDNFGGNGLRDLTGSLTVTNPFGARVDLGGAATQNVPLLSAVTEHATRAARVRFLNGDRLRQPAAGESFLLTAEASDPDVGGADGDGIDRVTFTLRRGGEVLTEHTETAAPYTFYSRGLAEPGVYTVRAEAFSAEDGVSRSVDVTPVEVLPAIAAVVVRARGRTGAERMELRIAGEAVAEWTVGTAFADYAYAAPSAVDATDVSVAFLNDDGVGDGTGRDLRVDRVTVGGTAHESEAASTYSTGTWAGGSGCAAGYKASEWLHCPGAFFYAQGDAAAPAVPEAAALGAALPEAYALEAVFPNPFGDRATVRFALPEPSAVRVEAFDVLGRRVAVLAAGEREAGRHEVSFDGSALPAGPYVVRFQAGPFEQAARVTVVR